MPMIEIEWKKKKTFRRRRCLITSIACEPKFRNILRRLFLCFRFIVRSKTDASQSFAEVWFDASFSVETDKIALSSILIVALHQLILQWRMVNGVGVCELKSRLFRCFFAEVVAKWKEKRQSDWSTILSSDLLLLLLLDCRAHSLPHEIIVMFSQLPPVQCDSSVISSEYAFVLKSIGSGSSAEKAKDFILYHQIGFDRKSLKWIFVPNQISRRSEQSRLNFKLFSNLLLETKSFARRGKRFSIEEFITSFYFQSANIFNKTRIALMRITLAIKATE